jgi:hypothetical protein
MKRLFLINVCLILYFGGYAQDRIFQIWNVTYVSVKLAEKTDLGISEKIHYTPSGEGLDMKYGQLLVTQKLNQWLSISAGFRLSASKDQGEWINEQRPMALFTLKKKIRNFELVFTNRFEYRFFKTKDSQFRDVQRFDIFSPTLSKWGIGLFTSEEAFYVPIGNKLDILRLYAGVSIFDKRKIGLRIYYIYQISKNEKGWDKADVAGLNFNFRI